MLAVAGWGGYFPWAVLALYAGAAGDPDAILEPANYWIVLLTGLAGIASTYLWWNFADQSHSFIPPKDPHLGQQDDLEVDPCQS